MPLRAPVRVFLHSTKNDNMKTSNPIIQQFIIEATLINPVNDIINKLENGNFRDCDIKWLDTKLENFTKFACETLGMTVIPPSEFGSERSYTILNEYLKSKYISRFKTLLAYFKSF